MTCHISIIFYCHKCCNLFNFHCFPNLERAPTPATSGSCSSAPRGRYFWAELGGGSHRAEGGVSGGAVGSWLSPTCLCRVRRVLPVPGGEGTSCRLATGSASSHRARLNCCCSAAAEASHRASRALSRATRSLSRAARSSTATSGGGTQFASQYTLQTEPGRTCHSAGIAVHGKHTKFQRQREHGDWVCHIPSQLSFFFLLPATWHREAWP